MTERSIVPYTGGGLPYEWDFKRHEKEDVIGLVMLSNGYRKNEDGSWHFDDFRSSVIEEEFDGQDVSFFGPGGSRESFFEATSRVGWLEMKAVLSQEDVLDLAERLSKEDMHQAERVSFIIGGLARHLLISKGADGNAISQATESVKFVAKMAKLGDSRSADAVASAAAMYVISGGPLDENPYFIGDIYHMAESVSEDSRLPVETTAELGLSQISRLRSFWARRGNEALDQVDIGRELELFRGFPTVGAEFHFDPSVASNDLWRRIALLNMSQYQPGSYVQFSRNDQGVVEVRMNPSIYPVSIANWENIRNLVPEMDEAYFSVTLNSDNLDFTWSSDHDSRIINRLRSLGLFTYAATYESIPETSSNGSIRFGGVYLGQTVRLEEEGYKFSGWWAGGEGKNGQLSIYTGYGDNFPQLAYYLSMALDSPDIMQAAWKEEHQTKNLNDAMRFGEEFRKSVFSELDRQIEVNRRLKTLKDAGETIMQELSPNRKV